MAAAAGSIKEEGLKRRGIHPLEQEQAQGELGKVKDAFQGLDQTLTLLRAKDDDTSRFVGLALLKSILDNRIDFQNDPEVVKRCWSAIPARFLDRLLRAPANQKNGKEESQSMVELAVAVLHAFIVLLPEDLKHDEKYLGRIERLVGALAWSPPDTTVQILQTLISLASTQRGSAAVLCAEKWPILVDIAPQAHLALDVIKFAFMNAPPKILEEPKMKEKAIKSLSLLISLFKETSEHALVLQTLHEILPFFPRDAVSSYPPWLGSLTELVYQSCLDQRGSIAARNRKPAVLLTASLLHLFPVAFPPLLFGGARKVGNFERSKPVSYLFVKLLIVDIRSTIPSLHEKVTSNDIPTLDGLAASYDIISAFIDFLVHILDGCDVENGHPSPFPFSPSLLLQLRAEISEAMSLTIEFLRDRFDKLTSHAANYRIEAPSSTKNSASTSRTDPLTLSQLRTLALWLREDDNNILRKEASSLTDIILALYAVDDQSLEFRSPLLIALEGILNVPEGVEEFLAAEGWPILARDLQRILCYPSGSDGAACSRAIEIVRILLSVVESDIVGPAKEEWMEIIKSSSSCAESVNYLDLKVAVAQLATELLTRAPRKVRRRWMGAAADVLAFAKRILQRDDVKGGLRDGAEEVMIGLESLGVGMQG